MKRQYILKLLFLSLILSSITSCGYFERWKTPEEPTDSNATASTDSAAKPSETDDLFSKTMNETKEEAALNVGTDAPKNITTENAEVKDDLKSLEAEFAQNDKGKGDLKDVKVEESLPVIKEEVTKTEEMTNPDAGKVMSYKVQKGETLMQIAFKIYGDISKWKHLQNMNTGKLNRNVALRTGMELKYKAPEKEFVWNPEGNPHMIKTGETLGTISNTYYKTPKKWKTVWENNKPLIKNPNVIFAGFTLYVKDSSMANYVEPASVQEKKSKIVIQDSATFQEKEKAGENEIDLTKEIVSAPVRNDEQSISDLKEELKDELDQNH